MLLLLLLGKMGSECIQTVHLLLAQPLHLLDVCGSKMLQRTHAHQVQRMLSVHREGMCSNARRESLQEEISHFMVRLIAFIRQILSRGCITP
jgi:hypothetical protein